MSKNTGIDSQFEVPPIFEDLSERVKEYLLKPENLPIHQWERSQAHWNREPNIDHLFHDDELLPPDTTLEVVRDPITGDITGIEEISIPLEDDEDSMSMSRPPLPPGPANLGTANRSPFLPAGFDEDLEEILAEARRGIVNIDLDNKEPGKFLGEDILTTAPGLNESVRFADDGFTLLNAPKESDETAEDIENVDMDVQINLKELVYKNARSICPLDYFKLDEEPEKQPQSPVINLELPTDVDAFFLEMATIKPPIKLPNIPDLDITSSKAQKGVTYTDMAEIIDVSTPVPDFLEKVGDMCQSYPFELDDFQKQAILKLEEGHHVFVAAHTSAGKTVVAEYAIAMSRRNCTRAIYTSPIKALSNQKYNDFKKMFGEVGLLTGDMKINTTAPCLVMTTEILLSMLYNASDVINDLEFVILDEIHYINDAERGHVWEEVIILLPAHVTIVMLSATVPNTLEFADWVGRIKERKVYIVSTPKRPVPLIHYLYTGTNNWSMNNKFSIVDQEGNFQMSGYNAAVAANGGRTHMSRRAAMVMWEALINHLNNQDQLPVIAFTLSRNKCDQNAECLMSMNLTTDEEKNRIRSFYQKSLQKLKETDRRLPQVTTLQRVLVNGIGVHHSGILPLLKEIVEMLFQSGLVKILFATETFAVGVNMPARTVVLDETIKFDGQVRRTLLPAEYIQMAGRAGRRGSDNIGSVIILCKYGVPELLTLKEMVSGIPPKLESKFRVTYDMILSLQRYGTVLVKGIMKRSFREFKQTDIYRKQLKLADKEYSEKWSAPLASHLEALVSYFDTASAYIDARDDIMPKLLNTAEVLKEMVPGRILIVSAGPYMNHLGVLLTNKSKRRIPYKVLVLEAKIQDNANYNFPVDENWYQMLGFFDMHDSIVAGTEESTLRHTVLCIAPRNVIAVLKMSLEFDSKIIIEDWEKRQLPRFKDAPVGPSCSRLVRELACISHAVCSGATVIEQVNLTQSLSSNTVVDKMNKCMIELGELRKSMETANFKTNFAIVYQRRLAECKREKCKQLLSFKNLALYPDYHSRVMVLRELGYINEQDSVHMKGQVACVMGLHNLMIPELLYRNILAEMTPTQKAALLSCFVFQGRSQRSNQLCYKLAYGVQEITKLDAELTAIEAKYSVSKFEGQVKRLNFDLVGVVYEWALQKPFEEIMELTDVQEGIIVRCIQQLHELLQEVKLAAEVVGDTKLRAEMMEASTAIRRDIICTHSLYTTQK